MSFFPLLVFVRTRFVMSVRFKNCFSLKRLIHDKTIFYLLILGERQSLNLSFQLAISCSLISSHSFRNPFSEHLGIIEKIRYLLRPMVMNQKYVYLREFSSVDGQRRMNIFAALTLSVISASKVLQIGHAFLTDHCC